MVGCEKQLYPELELLGFMFCFCRNALLTRHRSMTESSQTLRQVEMPKKITRAVRGDQRSPFGRMSSGYLTVFSFFKSKSKVSVDLEKPVADPQPHKQETQGVSYVF